MHQCVESYKLSMVRVLLAKTNVDLREVDYIEDEYGWTHATSKTALYLLCSRTTRVGVKRSLQLASLLLDSSADPNSLNTYYKHINDPEKKEYSEIMNPEYKEDSEEENEFRPRSHLERVIETPLSRAIRNGLSHMVWLLINRGAKKENIYVRCPLENFPTYYTENDELQEGLRQFENRDRKPGEIILNASELLTDLLDTTQGEVDIKRLQKEREEIING